MINISRKKSIEELGKARKLWRKRGNFDQRGRLSPFKSILCQTRQYLGEGHWLTKQGPNRYDKGLDQQNFNKTKFSSYYYVTAMTLIRFSMFCAFGRMKSTWTMLLCTQEAWHLHPPYSINAKVIAVKVMAVKVIAVKVIAVSQKIWSWFTSVLKISWRSFLEELLHNFRTE